MSGPEAPTDEQLYMRDARPVVRTFAPWHIEQSGGTLELLSYTPGDPPAIPEQDPRVYRIDGDPQSTQTIDQLGRMIEPSFDALDEKLRSQPGAMDTADEAAEHVASGGNLAVISPHDNIMDIAFAYHYMNKLLVERGQQPRSALIASRLICELGYRPKGVPKTEPPIPAISVVKMMYDYTYVGYARSPSSKDGLKLLPESQWKAHNRSMKSDFHDRLDEGGLEFALAPSGTTRIKKTEAGKHALEELGDGTIGMMTHPLNKVVGIAIRFGEGADIVMHEGLMQARDNQEAGKVMGNLEGLYGRLNSVK